MTLDQKHTFQDSVFVVFGASGGIGSDLVHRLRRRGSRVVCAGRNQARLNALAEESGAEACILDATQTSQVEGCISQVVDKYSRIDGIANCVGSLLLKPAHLTTDAEWSTTLATNLNSAFAVVRAGAKYMKNGGSVVLVSSAAARIGLANHEAIAAAKAGIIGLALSAAASYAAKGIRFNCVAPGLVQTPLTERITSNELALKGSVAMHALGRIGDPSDVASAIEWLLDPQNTWVTGQVLAVDGGLSSIRPRSNH